MRKPLTRLAGLAALVLTLSGASAARADVLLPPSRPRWGPPFPWPASTPAGQPAKPPAAEPQGERDKATPPAAPPAPGPEGRGAPGKAPGACSRREASPLVALLVLGAGAAALARRSTRRTAQRSGRETTPHGPRGAWS